MRCRLGVLSRAQEPCGFRVSGFGFRVPGVRFRISSSKFRVRGFACA